MIILVRSRGDTERLSETTLDAWDYYCGCVGKYVLPPFCMAILVRSVRDSECPRQPILMRSDGYSGTLGDYVLPAF